MTVPAAARWRMPAGRLHRASDRTRVHRGRPPSPAALSAILVAALAAGAVSGLATSGDSAASVAAATNTSLAARAAAISASITSDDTRLSALGERYLAQRAVYSAAAERSRQLRREIGRDAVVVARYHADVLDAAVSAYVNAGSDGNLALFLDGTASSLAAGQTYLRAASDQLGATLTQLRDATHALRTSLATERRVSVDASTALAATNADRTSVLRTVVLQRRLLAGVNGQLAALVHQELLARERAAAAAAAAARAAAARAAAMAAARAAAARAVTATTFAPGADGHDSPGAAPPAPAGPPAPTGVPPAPASPIPPGTLAQDFAAIRSCESSDDYTLDTGNGYYGAYQFGVGTWIGLGGTGLPSAAPPSVQDALAYRLYRQSGWSPWPECSAIIGL